jgi:hypothetical protein
MNKFEQLIEYVINDETAKARELFHDIVVEKSRQIYEEMMDEEAIAEESTHDEDEKAEKAGEKVTKDIEYDDKKDKEDKKMDEGMHDMEETSMGDDQADDLIDDIEVEEEGMAVEGESEEMADAELEDRVVDLEDKLDELMAEFEALMGDDGAGDEEVDTEVAMDLDTPDMDAEEVVDDEMETEGMMEAVNLKAAPAPVKSEEAGINKKSTVAANSGAVGAAAKPVNVDAGGEEKGRTAPQAKDMVGRVQNTPAQGSVKMDSAPKPVTAQASGVNTRTPFPKA